MTDRVIPSVTLNNGTDMPVLGLGVFLASPDEAAGAVSAALDNGYRMIDTAAAYLNERAVGAAISDHPVDRHDVFITTKLWVSQYGSRARAGFEASLERLGTDYLDLYLLHWPVPADFDQTIEAYRTAETLQQEGLVKAIGVCNFEPEHLNRLTSTTDVAPAVNQVELHPFFTQPAVRAANEQLGTITQAWAPIGGVYGRNPSAAPAGVTGPLDHPVVLQIADKYGKTPAQVVLRWHLYQQIAVIPKSVRASRIAENVDVFDFALDPAEITEISKLDSGRRAGSDPATFGIDSYSVDVESQ